MTDTADENYVLGLIPTATNRGGGVAHIQRAVEYLDGRIGI